MSHYYNRYCPVHGDWLMDVDNPTSYCLECGDPNEKIIAALRAEVERLTRAVEEAPHGMNCAGFPICGCWKSRALAPPAKGEKT